MNSMSIETTQRVREGRDIQEAEEMQARGRQKQTFAL